jgi:hypothetical protein
MYHILQEFYTLFLTRFRIYKIASLPWTKMTSKDDIKGLVSLKFLRPCLTPIPPLLSSDGEGIRGYILNKYHITYSLRRMTHHKKNRHEKFSAESTRFEFLDNWPPPPTHSPPQSRWFLKGGRRLFLEYVTCDLNDLSYVFEMQYVSCVYSICACAYPLKVCAFSSLKLQYTEMTYHGHGDFNLNEFCF